MFQAKDVIIGFVEAKNSNCLIQVNVIGPLVLFQASYPLLKASTPAPKFVVISSRAGSITLGPTIPGIILSYGVSKAAVNYLVRKLHFENDGLSKQFFMRSFSKDGN
jgi:NAD(P)-dependent dehydrogenase (short-subunit alcohol dehydrogenase family)